MAAEISRKIIAAEMPENWESLAKECLDNEEKLFSLSPLESVSNLMIEHDLEEYSAALLFHSLE
jgi:hypothetical protein